MIKITQLLRYPLKAHGREKLSDVTLIAGKTMPWDRVWAVAHEAAVLPQPGWASCRNFTRGASAPQLCAITSAFNESTGLLTLRHPQRPDITFDPDGDTQSFMAWVRPLMPDNRMQPTRIVKNLNVGYTDSDFASVSLCNLASHRDVEKQIGTSLSAHRWRSNIWFDGAAPWMEHDWVGGDIRVGSCVLRVIAPAERCQMTSTNPDTGQRDADVLDALNSFGHQDFSVLAQVVSGGKVAINDPIEVL